MLDRWKALKRRRKGTRVGLVCCLPAVAEVDTPDSRKGSSGGKGGGTCRGMGLAAQLQAGPRGWQKRWWWWCVCVGGGGGGGC